jgi:hypothetical protein
MVMSDARKTTITSNHINSNPNFQNANINLLNKNTKTKIYEKFVYYDVISNNHCFFLCIGTITITDVFLCIIICERKLHDFLSNENSFSSHFKNGIIF